MHRNPTNSPRQQNNVRHPTYQTSPRGQVSVPLDNGDFKKKQKELGRD
jgi:hypothetical protein